MHFLPVCVCTAGPAPMWEPSHWINVCRAAWEQSFVYVTVKMSWKLQQPSVSVLHDSPLRSGKARIMNYIMEYKYFIFREKVPSLWHCSFTSSRHFLIHTLSLPPPSLLHTNTHFLLPLHYLLLFTVTHTLFSECVSHQQGWPRDSGLYSVCEGFFCVCGCVCVFVREVRRACVCLKGLRAGQPQRASADRTLRIQMVWAVGGKVFYSSSSDLIWAPAPVNLLSTLWQSVQRSSNLICPASDIYIFFIFFVAVDSLCVTGLDTITCITVLHSGGFDKAAD